MDYTKDLENLCDVIEDQISDITRKVKNGGMTSGDLDSIEKLTHSLKSVKAVLSMGADGYSGRMYSDGRGSYRGPRRDSMGRYSGDYGYSRNDLANRMRELMHDAPDDRTRQEIQRLVDKIENA